MLAAPISAIVKRMPSSSKMMIYSFINKEPTCCKPLPAIALLSICHLVWIMNLKRMPKSRPTTIVEGRICETPVLISASVILFVSITPNRMSIRIPPT